MQSSLNSGARPLAASILAGLLAISPVSAQELNIQTSPLPQTGATNQNLAIPNINSFSMPEKTHELNLNLQPDGTKKATDNLDLKARLKDDSADISSGLVWRIFSPTPDVEGRLPLVASAKGGSASFSLEPGDYLVHVAYGRAGATKRIVLKQETRHEVMVLDAGGIELNAVLPDSKPLNEKLLKFSIYSGEESEKDRSLIVPNVKPNTIIRLNSGSYHVVSYYGDDNAIIRADIRVDPGKLTEATVQHRAAEVTLKLVRDKGGEALADTAWSILNNSGDVVKESVGAYTSMVLIEGDYVAVAKNKDRIYQRDFKVTSGDKEEVEVIANGENETNQDNSVD